MMAEAIVPVGLFILIGVFFIAALYAAKDD